MQAEAVRRVPSRTGRLLGTIKSRLTNEVNGILSIKLTAGGSVAPYWAFVEYGTGRRGQASRRGEVGTPTGWRYGTIAGQRAQPYLRPALLLVKRRIGQVGARRAGRG
jgi:HK97 gp10 family phage protein